MQKELLEYFQSTCIGPGLLLAEAPTGYGKTYQSVQAIYAYLKQGGNSRILFVTPLLKTCLWTICAGPMSRTDADPCSSGKCWCCGPQSTQCWMHWRI